MSEATWLTSLSSLIQGRSLERLVWVVEAF